MTQSNLLKICAALVVGGVAIYGIYGFNSEPRKAEVIQNPPATGGFTKALATGPMAGVLVQPYRKDLATITFSNAKGETLDLSKWKGRVVLLNLWATWCAPCRKEMPDLAKLQTSLGGPDFEVIALSLDRKGLAASQAFLSEIGATSLAAYVEPEGKTLATVQALGLPATLLIDRKGQEAARILGPAEWASPEAQAMVKALLAEK